MRVGYSFSWFLPTGDPAAVRGVIESLRQHAVELGGAVGDVSVLSSRDAEVRQPGARAAVAFCATLPGASEGWYGLATIGISSGPLPWSWHGAVVISDATAVSQLHAAAAGLGLEMVEGDAGMNFESRREAPGVVRVEQQRAFEGDDF